MLYVSLTGLMRVVIVPSAIFKRYKVLTNFHIGDDRGAANDQAFDGDELVDVCPKVARRSRSAKRYDPYDYKIEQTDPVG